MKKETRKKIKKTGRTVKVRIDQDEPPMEVQDEITGFTGIAMAYCIYKNRCEHILVQPQGLKDCGDVKEGIWFDIQRLTDMKGNSLDWKGTGGPGGSHPGSMSHP